MRKICECCFEIYSGDELINFCPKVKCKCDSELVEIDDLLVDVIIKFWQLEVQTIASCAGHLYEDVFSPYIIFFAKQFEEENLSEISEYNLEDLRGIYKIFTSLKYNANKFKISDIEVSSISKGYQFSIGPSSNNIDEDQAVKEIRKRLKMQNDFLNFLYDGVEQIQKERR